MSERLTPLGVLIEMIESHGLCAAFGMLDLNDEEQIGPLVLNALRVQSESVACAWIPFSERAPGENLTNVIACYGDGSTEIYPRQQAVEYAIGDDPLTHWMPLPEAPK